MGKLSKSIQGFLSAKQQEVDSDIENDQFVKVKDVTKGSDSDESSYSSVDEFDILPKNGSVGRRVKFAEDSYTASQSILRKNNKSSILLDELTQKGSKFIGKKVNRKDLGLEESFAGSDSQGSSSSSSDFSDECEQLEEFSNDSESLDEQSGEEVVQKDSGSLDENDASDENDYFQQLKTMDKKEQKEDGKIQLMGQENALKGRHMKNQMKAIDAAYQCRILLQKVLLAVNRWPDSSDFEKLQSFMDSLDRTIILNQPTPVELIQDTMKNLTHLLTQNYMLELSCMNSFDGEFPKESLTDCSFSTSSLDDIWDVMSEKASRAWPWIDETLDKWWQKTHFNAGASLLQNKYKAIHQNLKTQIDFTLQDEGRLLKRTRQNRSGQPGLTLPTFPESINTMDQDDVMLCEELFDDSDFYKLLLKDIIETKVSTMQQNEINQGDNDDGIHLTHRYLEEDNNNNNNKTKKLKVGGKTSKGKMIRYDIHPKLVNFMALIPFVPGLDEWTDTKMDELYQSLPKVELTTQA